MAYLGIREKDNSTNENGVYYFSSLGMRDDVGAHFENPSYYVDKEKQDALKDFNIEESEIKDGSVLIRKYIHNNDKRRSKRSKYYLGLIGTPFDGVYVFNYETPRNNMAENFDNTYISNNIDEVVKEFGALESDIKDASFLFENRVQGFIAKNKKKADKSKQVSESKPVETKSIVSENTEVKEKTETVEKKKGNILKRMIDELKKENDIVELTFSNGYIYRIAIRDMFLLRNDVTLQNCAKTVDGSVTIVDSAIDKLIDKEDIIHISRSIISYSDDYAVFMNCDDIYSPNVNTDEKGRFVISHYIPKIVLNANEIVSVTGMFMYPEIAIDFHKIESSNNKLVYDYLRNKFN